jgi:hypothetical protein
LDDVVERARDAERAAVQDVRIDLRGANVRVAQQFLDGPNVVAALEKVRPLGHPSLGLAAACDWRHLPAVIEPSMSDANIKLIAFAIHDVYRCATTEYALRRAFC